MKIAIVADTHDNLPCFKKAMGWIKSKKIKMLIHCGDVSKEEMLKEALGDFNGRIYLCRGNCDIDSFKKIPNLKVFDEFGEVKLVNKKIAFCHFPKTALDLANSGKYNVVFYGHDHKPWVNTLRHGSLQGPESAPQGQSKAGQETKLANPGNLAGVYYKATFATYDTKTDKLELQILERL